MSAGDPFSGGGPGPNRPMGSQRPTLGVNTHHAHRNSFSAATFHNYFGQPPANPYARGFAQQARPPYIADLPWPVFALDWHAGASQGRASGRIAIGSFCDDAFNRIGMLQYTDEGELIKTADLETPLPFPVTQVKLEPPTTDRPHGNLVASVGDYLRIFSIHDAEQSGRRLGVIRQEALLGNTKPDFSAPLTALSWNKHDTSIIATASVDTTCTIWDLNTQQARTQLIAHDKEVFDVEFLANSVDVFASVGADGSVRMFDLRALEHSTILYEAPLSMAQRPSSRPDSAMAQSAQSDGKGATAGATPLLRLAACPAEPNLLATFHAHAQTVQILDVRRPGTPLLELDAHVGTVNALAWCPTAKNILATVADDAQILVWDLNANASPGQTPVTPASTTVGGGSAGSATSAGSSGATMARIREPLMAYTAESELNNLAWSGDGTKIVTTFGRHVQVVRL
ncbi:hypothetical protein PYCC9005_002390 [Savitreella phatthalungensis]